MGFRKSILNLKQQTVVVIWEEIANLSFLALVTLNGNNLFRFTVKVNSVVNLFLAKVIKWLDSHVFYG
jgi:hypothetical protein